MQPENDQCQIPAGLKSTEQDHHLGVQLIRSESLEEVCSTHQLQGTHERGECDAEHRGVHHPEQCGQQREAPVDSLEADVECPANYHVENGHNKEGTNCETKQARSSRDVLRCDCCIARNDELLENTKIGDGRQKGHQQESDSCDKRGLSE